MATDNKNKVLNVPHLRFPEFSGEWEKYRLCDVASIVGRIGFRGYTTNDIVTKGKGAIALSPTNIENNKLTYDKDNTYISFYKYEESPEIMIKQGDVIFVKTGSTVGKVAYVDKLICKTTLNPQVVVLKDIQCDNYLLSVLMSTNKFQNAIRKIIVGGAVPTLSQAAMGDIVVTMPQATEQEKLSKFISLLDDRIATQNKIIEDLKILKSAIAERLFNSTDGDILSLSDVCIIQKGKQVNGEDLSETGKFYVMNGGVEPSGYYDQCNTPANTISISEGGNSCGYIQYNRDAFWSGGHCYTL
ncbi:restriction endonuclease subunit S, partial [uncultured Phocaeicola sp.]